MWPFGKSQREKDLEQLVKMLQEKVDRWETRELTTFVTPVRAPGPGEMPEYMRLLAQLTANEMYLYHWSQTRRSITDDFEQSGADKAEFYRGKLAAIGDIFRAAKVGAQKYGEYLASQQQPEARQ